MPRAPKPEGPTPGAGLLTDWLARVGRTQVDLAPAIGVSVQLVRQWASGANRPSHEHARALELLTGGDVPHTAWADAGIAKRLATSARKRLGIASA
jgi:DNA-binding transcriptional regulator YdaS (Cro superfamily)